MAKVVESVQIETSAEETSASSAGTDDEKLYMKLEKENEIRTQLAEFARELAMMELKRQKH